MPNTRQLTLITTDEEALTRAHTQEPKKKSINNTLSTLHKLFSTPVEKHNQTEQKLACIKRTSKKSIAALALLFLILADMALGSLTITTELGMRTYADRYSGSSTLGIIFTVGAALTSVVLTLFSLITANLTFTSIKQHARTPEELNKLFEKLESDDLLALQKTISSHLEKKATIKTELTLFKPSKETTNVVTADEKALLLKK